MRNLRSIYRVCEDFSAKLRKMIKNSLQVFAVCALFVGMRTQDANCQERPQWAQGLTDEQIAALRREAIRQGKRPAELVRECITELAAKLSREPSRAA